MTLKDAQSAGKLNQFVRERKNDAPGDEEAFNRAFRSMAGTLKAAPEASPPDDCDD